MTPKHFSTLSRFVTRCKYYPDEIALGSPRLGKNGENHFSGPSDHKVLGQEANSQAFREEWFE
jgi:hypothetical protein